MENKLSPEEILRMKEIEGGIEYDEHINKKESSIVTIEKEAEVKSEIENSQGINNVEPEKEQPTGKKLNIVNPDQGLNKDSLGKAQNIPESPSFDNGWKNLPVNILPSKGMFYPDGTRIAIRAAEVKEIRHFSTIDEDDRIDIEEKLGMVLDSCMRIDFPGEGVVSFKDLKVED